MGRFSAKSSKAITYLLLAGVLVLWGSIFLKVFQVDSINDIPVREVKRMKTSDPKFHNHQQEGLRLDLGFRNPFAPSTFDRNVEPESEFILANQALNAEKPKIDWSVIKYHGFIKNNNTGRRLAILAIKGEEVLLAVGERNNGVKLVSLNTDSVRVDYLKTTKYIKIR